jgi:ribosomal protein S18 acetylase RimI-like enzyme
MQPKKGHRQTWKIELLDIHHDKKSFYCGDETLDHYLKTQASQDVRRNVSRIYVAVGDDPHRVLGFYSISNFSIEAATLPINVAKKLPRYPVPAALIGRLAVDKNHQGLGLGEYLLVDALERLIDLSEHIAINTVVVDAKDNDAKSFYKKYDFISFADAPPRLYIQIGTLKKYGGCHTNGT